MPRERTLDLTPEQREKRRLYAKKYNYTTARTPPQSGRAKGEREGQWKGQLLQQGDLPPRPCAYAVQPVHVQVPEEGIYVRAEEARVQCSLRGGVLLLRCPNCARHRQTR